MLRYIKLPKISDKTKSRLVSIIRKQVSNIDIDYSIFENMDLKDWEEIMFLSKMHCIQAIVFDEILKFPEYILPNQKLRVKMFAAIEAVKYSNNKINSTLKKILKEYNNLDLKFINIKGPVCAINYPQPELRCTGDLDIYLYRKDDFKKANDWVISQGYKYYKDEIKLGHWAFEYNDIIIENHNNITFFEKEKYNSAFERIISNILSSKDFKSITINKQIQVVTLNETINYLYIYLHLFFHFIHGGTGFRQYMDWIYFSLAHKEKINREKMDELIKTFSIHYPISIFATIAIKYLGLSESHFPFSIKNVKDNIIDLIYKDIINCGNFGILRTNYLRGRWLGYIDKLLSAVSRSIKLYKIAPDYVVLVPIKAVKNKLILMKKGL